MARQRDDIPSQAGATLGSSGVNVQRLQNYLSRFGYMDTGAHAQFGMSAVGAAPAPEKAGEFDEATREALQKFQEFTGLPITGRLDQAVIDLIQKKRCGVPDVGEYVQPATAAEYELWGKKWDKTHLRYGFQEFSGDLSESQIRNAVSAGLNYWASVTPLSFSEIAIGDDPEIRIRFVTGEHGDGAPFDGQGGTLAHAFYPGQGEISGDSHFDDAEKWTIDLPPSGIDLYTVAAHEFGHALGLKHSSVNDALMYPFYSGAHRYLHQDDIDGIQELYGAEEWHSSKLCLRAYATFHSKNAWAYIQDVGWRKIRPQNPDGVTDMLYAVSEARVKAMPLTVLATDQELLRLYL